MSPFWAETAILQLAPGCLRVGGRSLPLAGDLPAALAALPADLLPRGQRCRLVVDDGLLRYALIRWPAGLGRGAEGAAFVAHRLGEVHGIAAPEWCWRVDPEPPPRPALACAMPTALAAAVHALVRARGWRLAEFTGAFTHRYNQVRRRLKAPLGALLVEGAGRQTLGLWRQGQWQAIRNQSAGDPGAALNLLVGACGLGGEAGVLYGAGLAGPLPAGWQAVPLDGGA